MLDEALIYITKQLNFYLKKEFNVSHDCVALTPISGASSNAKLYITLIHIEEETSIKNQVPTESTIGDFTPIVQPLYIHLQILVSVSPNTPYIEGLKYLSKSLGYFHQNPILLPSSQVLPNGIDKLTFSLMHLNIENQKNIWQNLGCTYQPSVVYKMGLLKIGGIE